MGLRLGKEGSEMSSETRIFKYEMITSLVCGIERYGLILKEEGKEDIVIEDITVERRMIEVIIALFNREQLSPLHLADALEDILP